MSDVDNDEPIPRRKSRALPAGFDSAILTVAILVFWEVGVRVGDVPAYLLPPPSMIVERLFTEYKSIAYHTAMTTGEILLGFLLSIVVSIPLAALLAQFRWFERALYPVLVTSQTIPKVAIAPLLVVWFGFGLMPKVLIAFLICFFPIVVDTLVGFRSVPKEVLWLAQSMGASNLKTFRYIQVPAALPSIFAGIKVASTLAVVGAVVSEFVASDRGLGYLLIVANGTLDVRLAFAVLVMLSVIGILLFAAVSFIERLLLPWHISGRPVKSNDRGEAA